MKFYELFHLPMLTCCCSLACRRSRSCSHCTDHTGVDWNCVFLTLLFLDFVLGGCVTICDIGADSSIDVGVDEDERNSDKDGSTYMGGIDVVALDAHVVGHMFVHTVPFADIHGNMLGNMLVSIDVHADADADVEANIGV